MTTNIEITHRADARPGHDVDAMWAEIERVSGS
jgi:hypothetical protein